MSKRKNYVLMLAAVLFAVFALTVLALTAGGFAQTTASANEVPNETSVWDGTSSDTSFYSFTTNNLYINSAAQLRGLAVLSSTGFTYEGFNVKLMKDIDLNGNEWSPIDGFAGVFDGDGHTVKNFTLKRVGVGSAGFFGTVTKIATIKNLTLDNVATAVTSAQVAEQGYGLLLGTNTANGTQILNCTLKHAFISAWGATSNAGGAALLIGQSTGSIKIDNCNIISCAMTEMSNLGYAFGGIIGRIQSDYYASIVSNCSVYNTIITNYKNTGSSKGFIAGQGSNFTVTNFKSNMLNYCGKLNAATGRYDISGLDLPSAAVASINVPNGGEPIGSAYDKLTYLNKTPLFGTKVTGVTYTDAPWITALTIDGTESYSAVYGAKGVYTHSGNIGTVSITFPVDVTASITVNSSTVTDTNADAKVVEFAVGDGLKQSVVNITIDGVNYNSFTILSGTLPTIGLYLDNVAIESSASNLGYVAADNVYNIAVNKNSVAPVMSVLLSETLPEGMTAYINDTQLVTGTPVVLSELPSAITYSLVTVEGSKQKIGGTGTVVYNQFTEGDYNIYWKNDATYPWTENAGTWTCGNKGQTYTDSMLTFVVKNISNFSLTYTLSTQTQYSFSEDTFSITVDGTSKLSKSGIVAATAFSQDLDAATTHTIVINRNKPGYYSTGADTDTASFSGLTFTAGEGSGLSAPVTESYNNQQTVELGDGDEGGTTGGTITPPDGAIQLSGNVYYVNDATFPWNLSNGEFTSTNKYTDKTTSVLTLYLYGVDTLYLDYSYWTYSYTWAASFTVKNVTDSANPIQLFQLVGKQTSFLTKAISFDAVGDYVISIEYFVKSNSSGMEDAVHIKNINAGVSTDTPACTISYDTTVCDSVINLYDFAFSAVTNGTSYITWASPVQFFVVPKDGCVFAGYKVNGGDLIPSNGDILRVFGDVSIELVCLPRLIISDAKLSEFAYAYTQDELNVPETEIGFYEETVLTVYPTDNSLSVTAPELGLGESCDLYVNGVFKLKMVDDNNRYFGLLSNVAEDSTISLVYSKDGYGSTEFIFKVKFSFETDTIVTANSQPVEIINDPSIPYSFDLAHSSADRLAFKAGNTGLLSSVSTLKIKVTGTGILYFDYYVSCEGGDSADVALFAINNDNLKLDTTSNPTGVAFLPMYGDSDNVVCTNPNNAYFGYIGVDYVGGVYQNVTNVDGSDVRHNGNACGNIGWKKWQISIDAAELGSEENYIYLAFCKGISNHSDTFEDTFSIANVSFFSGVETLSYASSNASAEAGTVSATIDGTATASETVISVGKTVTMTATANEGYRFYGWIQGGVVVNTAPSYTYTITDSAAITAVIEPIGTYKAHDDGAFYATFNDAAAAAAVTPNGNIVITEDTTVTANVTIPANVTVLLPYSSTDTVGTAVGGTTNKASWNAGIIPTYTLTVADGVTITVGGNLIVGGVQHYADQSAQGHTSGAYSKLVNNGTVAINDGATLKVYGLVTGSGIITANDGATVSQPFLVNNYSGGTNTQALYNANQFPFVQFSTINIQCEQSIAYGAKVVGMTSLFFYSAIHLQDIVLIDKIENKGTVGSLIWMKSGSSLKITYDATKRVNNTVGNINLADSGVSTITVIGGEVDAGEFYLQGYGSSDMVLAIPYTYQITVGNNAVLNIPNGRAYKVMPGSVVTVDAGGTLNVLGALHVYDGLIQSDKSGKLYPSSTVLTDNGFSASGNLIVNGTMNVTGSLTGIVQTAGTTGKVVVDADATLSATLTEGCAGGYTDNSASFASTARMYGPVNGAIAAIQAGKTYQAFGANGFVLPSYTMISAARCTELTATINQAMTGRFVIDSGEGVYNATATFSIGEELANVTVNVSGTSYYTDSTGCFTAPVTFDSTGKITYYTPTKDGASRHYYTLLGNEASVILTEVIKNATLNSDNVTTRVFNAAGTLVTDYTLNADLNYYGGGVKTVELSFTGDDSTKYAQSVTLSNSEYAAASFTAVTLNTVTEGMVDYVNDCDALSAKSSSELVDYANSLYQTYTTLKTGRTAAEISFLDAYLATDNPYNAYTGIVKSVTATSEATYGDTSISANLTKVDGTVASGSISAVSYTLNLGVFTGEFEYKDTFAGVQYVIAITVDDVKQRAITVTINNKTSIYGNATADLTADVTTGSLAYDDTVATVVSLAKANGNTVGNYTISGQRIDSKYIVTFLPEGGANYSITERPVTVTIADKTSVYGDDFVTLTGAITEGTLVGGDALSAICEFTKAEGVKVKDGGYAITGTDKSTNYAVSFVDGVYTITERPITVTIANKSSVYGNTFVTLTGAITTGSLVDGDALSAVCEFTKAEGVKVKDGGYAITGADTSTDYAVSFVDGVYTITERAITVTIANKSSVYGNTFVTLTGAVTTGSLVDGDALSAVCEFTKADGVKVKNGGYAITGADTSTDYAVSFVDGTYTITERPITVTIANKTSVYGDTFVTLTGDVTVGSLVEGDQLSAVCEFTKAEGVKVKNGGYAITGADTSTDYAVSFVDGVYTITERPVTVTIADKTSVYGDNFVALSGAVTVGTLAFEDTLASICEFTKAEGVNVKDGGYAITGTDTSTNYAVSFVDGTYSITARPVTVTIANKTSVYGSALAELTATVTVGNLGYTDELSGVVSLGKAEGVTVKDGGYAITGTELSANYAVSFVDGTYTITERAITVTIANKTSVYGDNFVALSGDVTVGSLVEGDKLSAICEFTKAEGVKVKDGGYAITGADLSTDYAVTFVDGTYTITERPITVTIANKTSVYGDNLVALSGDVTEGNLVEGDQLSAICEFAKAEGVAVKVGGYAITGTDTSTDYAVGFVNGVYTITAKDVDFTTAKHHDVMLSKAGNSISFNVTQSDGCAATGITFEIKQNNVLFAEVSAQGVVTMAQDKTFAIGVYQVYAVNNDTNYALKNNVPGELELVEDNDYYTVEFKFSANNKIYDGEAVTVTITAKVTETGVSEPFSGKTITYNNTTVSEIRKAGTYTVSVTVAEMVYTSEIYTVGARTLGITWDTPDFTYDGTAQKLGFSFTNVVGDDKVRGVYGEFDCTSAGNHTAVVSALDGADKVNYQLPAAAACSFEYAIAERAITVTIANKTSVYGNAIVTLTGDVTEGSLVYGDALSAICEFAKAEGVKVKDGGYAITGTDTSTDYAVSFVDGTYTITERAITVTIADKTSVYGDNFVALSGDVTVGSLVAGDALSAICEFTKAEGVKVKDGGYAITGTDTSTDYAVSFVDGTYTITERPITVTIANKTSVYGDEFVALSGTVTVGSLAFEDTVAAICELTKAEGVKVKDGGYAITGADASTDYQINFVDGVYTITERAITVTIDNKTSVYGDSFAALSGTVTVGSLAFEDTVAAICELTKAEGVKVKDGGYAITGADASTDYAVSFVDGIYTITERPITVTIANKTSVYGDEFVTLTGAITEGTLVDGDALSAICEFAKAEGVKVKNGGYAITGTDTSTDYAVSFVDGIYTITERPITVTIADKASVYGDEFVTLTGEITEGTLVDGDQLSAICEFTKANGVKVKDGGYAITGSDTSTDYAVSFVDGTYTISARVVTVTIANKTSVYGDNLEALSGTVTVGSLAFEDTVVAICELTKAEGVKVKDGGYAITGTDTSTDYTVSFVDGTYTITARPITVTIANKTSVYGDSLVAVTAEITEGKLAFEDAESDVYSIAKAEGVEVKDGGYAITGTSLSTDYAISFVDGTYAITARPITVTIDNKTSVYGDAFAALSAAITTGSLVDGDTTSSVYSIIKINGAAVGEYAITGRVLDSNYNVTFIEGNYTVTARPITVNIADQTSVYGDAEAPLSAILGTGTIANNDVFDQLFTLAKANGSTVGEYDIDGTSVSRNYNISFVKGTYTITAKELKIDVLDAQAVYGNADSTLTAQVSEGYELVGTDKLASILSLSRESGTAAGTYDIYATDLGNPNYTVTVVYTTPEHSEYVINKAPVTVTIGDLSLDNNSTWADLTAGFDYSISGKMVDGDELNVVLSAVLSSGVTLTESNFTANFIGGTHSIVGTYNNGNYDVTFVDGVLSVTKRQVSVSGIVTEYTYTGRAISAFDWATNVSGYLPSATANTFKATLTKDGEEVTDIVDAGVYTMVITIVHVHAYEFADDAVTTYTINVGKKDISDAIEFKGVENGGVYESRTGMTAVSGTYEVELNKVLSKDGTVVDEATEIGSYVYTVTVDDANYKGSKVASFRIVVAIEAKMTSLSQKLEEVNTSDGDDLTTLLAIRTAIAAFTADDLILIAQSEEYTELVDACGEAWAAYVAVVETEMDLADRAAHCNTPNEIITLLSALATALWFAPKFAL